MLKHKQKEVLLLFLKTNGYNTWPYYLRIILMAQYIAIVIFYMFSITMRLQNMAMSSKAELGLIHDLPNSYQITIVAKSIVIIIFISMILVASSGFFPLQHFIMQKPSSQQLLLILVPILLSPIRLFLMVVREIYPRFF